MDVTTENVVLHKVLLTVEDLIYRIENMTSDCSEDVYNGLLTIEKLLDNELGIL